MTINVLGKLSALASLAFCTATLGATAFAQTETCPEDARAQIVSLDKQVVARTVAAQQTPPETKFIPNQDDMFKQAYNLMNACPDNTTVNQKLPFILHGLSTFSDAASQRAAIADLAYTAMMRAKTTMQETIDDPDNSEGLKKAVSGERKMMMADLGAFIIPAMYEHGAMSDSGYRAFALQDSENACPYADSERALLFSELESHRETALNVAGQLFQSGYVLAKPPLEYRLKALRKACPDHARQITYDMASHWALIADAAQQSPDALLVSGDPQPSDLVDTAMAEARELLDMVSLLREDPAYSMNGVPLSQQLRYQAQWTQRTGLASRVRSTLKAIEQARSAEAP